MRSRSVLAALAVVVALGLAACGGGDGNDTTGVGSTPTTTSGAGGGKVIQRNAANASKPQITMGSKNFTENLILGEIYAQALQAGGYKVKTQLDLGSEQIALRALKAGRIDAYPEYTGTVLTSFCKIKDKDVPHDPDQAYAEAKDCIAEQGIEALPRTPFTNSNGFAVTQDTAKKLGDITKLSDLAGKASSLTISGPPECQQRTDCLLGLESVYGLHFNKFLSIDISKRSEVIKNGQTDVGEVFTTDGQIKADNLVLLEDDKQLFPPYNSTLLAGDTLSQQEGPDFARIVASVCKGLTTEVMQELNSRVDLDKETPKQVAAEYLREAGYLQ